MSASGNIRKMSVQIGDPIMYTLNLSTDVDMNARIGKHIRLEWNGIINCLACKKVTKKSFGQGFCYTCFMNAPESAE